MTKAEKSNLRADLFRHLDGIVTAPTTYTLHEGGVLTYILKKEKVALQELSKTFKANEGYLNVGLRVLAAQGWLDYEIVEENDIWVYTNKKSAIAFGLIPLFKDVVDLIQQHLYFII